jgi:hypothetical protein
MVETRRVTASLFTVIWMVLGAFLNVVLLGTVPLYRLLLALLGVDRFTPEDSNALIFATDANLKYLPFHTIMAATILAAVGLLFLFLSSRLDFVDHRDDPARNGLIPACLGLFFGISWICFLATAYILSVGNNPGLLEILFMIPMVVLALPILFVNFLYIFGCTSLFLAGLITLPRTVYAYSRRHQLTQAWSQGIRSSQIDPSAVISSFGDRTNTGAEGRKLRKDADRLQREVQGHVDRLRTVRDKLRAEVLSNDEAAAIHREADGILAKVAALKAGRGD